MNKKHWIDFLINEMAIKHIFQEDNEIPNLHSIIIEHIVIGFNLNSLKVSFNFPLPKNLPKKFKLKKYNILEGDLVFSNISKLKIEKKILYETEENYTFLFTEIENNLIKVQIKGSLGSELKFVSEYIDLLNFGGGIIEKCPVQPSKRTSSIKND